MSRAVPPIRADLAISIDRSLLLAEKSEYARVVLQRHPIVQSRLHYRDVNFLYEAAYLRMFVAWEDYLDRAFVYLLCGRHHADGMSR